MKSLIYAYKGKVKNLTKAVEAHEREAGWLAAKAYTNREPESGIPFEFLTGTKEFRHGWCEFMEGRPT